MISEQLLTKIKPFIDLQQPQSYYLILSSKTAFQMQLPQDVFYQEGILTFKNKQPVTFYMIYDGQEDLHIEMHFQSYSQVDLIQVN